MKKLALLILLSVPLAAQNYTPALRFRPTAGVGYQSGFTGPDCWPGNRALPEPAFTQCILTRYGHNNGCPPSGQPTNWVFTHYCAEKEDWNAIILHHACLAGDPQTPGGGECEPTVLEMTDLEQTAIRGSSWACQHLMPGLRGPNGIGLSADNPERVSYPVGSSWLGGGKWAAGLQQKTEPASGCSLYYFNTPPVVVPPPVPPPVPIPVPPPAPICPAACVPQPLPKEALDTISEAKGWKLIGAGRAARLGRAEKQLREYKPCLQSTGLNVMNLHEPEGAWAFAPEIGSTNDFPFPAGAFEVAP